jgi:hypothetical protein
MLCCYSAYYYNRSHQLWAADIDYGRPVPCHSTQQLRLAATPSCCCCCWRRAGQLFKGALDAAVLRKFEAHQQASGAAADGEFTCRIG